MFMRSLPLPLIRRLVPLNGLGENSLQTLLERCEWQLVGRGQRLLPVADMERIHTYLVSGEALLRYAQEEAVQTPDIPFPVGYGTQGLLSATALTDCVCLRVDRQLLERQLCWDHVAAALELALSYRQEQDEESGWQLTLLKSNLFVKVPPLNVGQIYTRLRAMQVRKGDVILKQGEAGDGCYFIRRGRAAVTRRFPGEDVDRHIVDIGYGRCFGEDALIHDTVRNASVTMISDGLLMRLDKPDFMLLLRETEVDCVRASDLEGVEAGGAVMLDVRMPEEYNIARLQGAKNAPLSSLPLLMSVRLGMQQEYVTYCENGQRSRAAAALLQQRGYRARYLSGGLQGLGSDQRKRLLDVVPPVVPMPVHDCQSASA